MKQINKILFKYIKQVKINKTILTNSLRASVVSLMKIFLLHKLQQFKYFKPVSFILKIITKWSLYTTLISILYSLICSIIGFKYDLGFLIGILSAIWILISELSVDMIFDIWDKVILYYNKILAKIIIRLSKQPETIDYAEKAKNLFAKYKKQMPTDPKVKFYNEDEMLEEIVTRQIEEERRKDPNYRPKSNGWFSWYPLSFKDTLYYVSYLVGTITAISATYYFFDQVSSIINTLREFNNFRRNIPGYLTTWLWNKIWRTNTEAPALGAPAAPEANNSWFNWVPNIFGRSSNIQPTPENTNTSILRWLKNIIPNPFGGGDNNNPPAGGGGGEGEQAFAQSQTVSTIGIGILAYFLRRLGFATDTNVDHKSVSSLTHSDSDNVSERILEEQQSTIYLMLKVFSNKSDKIIDDPDILLDLIKNDDSFRNLIYSNPHLEDFYSDCIKLLYTIDIKAIEVMNKLIRIKYADLIDPVDVDSSSDEGSDSDEGRHTPRPFSPLSNFDPTEPDFDFPGGWNFIYLIIMIKNLSFIFNKVIIIVKYIKKIFIYFKNYVKQIIAALRAYLTKLENKINSYLIIKPKNPNDGADGNNYLSKMYHINNYNNYDIPFKIIIKFLDSLKLDLAWNKFPNEIIQNIALDRCILLTIKIQVCDFYINPKGANGYLFNPFIPTDPNDYYINNYPIFIVNNNLPLDLTEDKYIFEMIFLNSAIINSIIRDIDNDSDNDNDFDIIFEYKYITIEEFNNLLNIKV